MTTDQVRFQAMQLPADERALLAHDLLASLEPQESPDVVEAAWLEEIETRAEAFASGTMAADDWQVSLERVRQRLRERRRP